MPDLQKIGVNELFYLFFSPRKHEREKNGADNMPTATRLSKINKLQVNRDTTNIFSANRILHVVLQRAHSIAGEKILNWPDQMYSVHRIHEPWFVISRGKRSLSV